MTNGPLRRRDLLPDPVDQLRTWLGDAAADPMPMILSTVGRDGRPATRPVPLRHLDADGLLFFTSTRSDKAVHLAERPDASTALFVWPSLRRQVRIDTSARFAPATECDAWFANHPRAGQAGAWETTEPTGLQDRAELEARVAHAANRFAGNDPIPRPDHWVVVRLVPIRWEFWQAGADRAHDRFRYDRLGDQWDVRRIMP